MNSSPRFDTPGESVRAPELSDVVLHSDHGLEVFVRLPRLAFLRFEQGGGEGVKLALDCSLGP
ncbi:hypothetical protein Scel_11110 [Streptomyces cellostaticus]|nr:hypothetical protein Scel_11110 [Streptomyces cellostaticus]